MRAARPSRVCPSTRADGVPRECLIKPPFGEAAFVRIGNLMTASNGMSNETFAQSIAARQDETPLQNSEVRLKPDATHGDSEVRLKPDATYGDSEVRLKPDATYGA